MVAQLQQSTFPSIATIPPKYESKATFLRRHRLLLPGEVRKLKSADFEPEIVIVTLDTPAGGDDPTETAAPSMPLRPAVSPNSRGIYHA